MGDSVCSVFKKISAGGERLYSRPARSVKRLPHGHLSGDNLRRATHTINNKRLKS